MFCFNKFLSCKNKLAFRLFNKGAEQVCCRLLISAYRRDKITTFVRLWDKVPRRLPPIVQLLVHVWCTCTYVYVTDNRGSKKKSKYDNSTLWESCNNEIWSNRIADNLLYSVIFILGSPTYLHFPHSGIFLQPPKM